MHSKAFEINFIFEEKRMKMICWMKSKHWVKNRYYVAENAKFTKKKILFFQKKNSKLNWIGFRDEEKDTVSTLKKKKKNAWLTHADSWICRPEFISSWFKILFFQCILIGTFCASNAKRLSNFQFLEFLHFESVHSKLGKRHHMLIRLSKFLFNLMETE